MTYDYKNLSKDVDQKRRQQFRDIPSSQRHSFRGGGGGGGGGRGSANMKELNDQEKVCLRGKMKRAKSSPSVVDGERTRSSSKKTTTTTTTAPTTPRRRALSPVPRRSGSGAGGNRSRSRSPLPPSRQGSARSLQSCQSGSARSLGEFSAEDFIADVTAPQRRKIGTKPNDSNMDDGIFIVNKDDLPKGLKGSSSSSSAAANFMK